MPGIFNYKGSHNGKVKIFEMNLEVRHITLEILYNLLYQMKNQAAITLLRQKFYKI
jgi:hypothetical protein